MRDIMPSEVTRIVVDKDELAGQIHRLLRVWYPSAAAAGEELSHLAVRTATAALDAPLGELRAQEEARQNAETDREAAEAESVDGGAAAAENEDAAAPSASSGFDGDLLQADDVDDDEDADEGAERERRTRVAGGGSGVPVHRR